MAELSINRNIELKMSFEWIKLSFYIFRERALQFIILGIFSTLIGLLPLFGSFMAPLFIAKYALLAKRVEQNESVKISEVFDNFFANKTVVRLAFLNFVLNSIIFVGQYLVELGLPHFGITDKAAISGILMLFFIPVIILQLSMWLSPIICLEYPNIEPKSAMWLSIKAGVYNIPTLLLYSILVIMFTLIAIIPIGLGLLIWLPILNIACYFVYKSMFIRSS